MTALIFAAWLAATVARLAAALRRLADAVAPLTVEAPAPRPHRAPAPRECADCGAPDTVPGYSLCLSCLGDMGAACAPAPRPVPAPAAVASRATPVAIDPRARRPAPDHAAETAADVADPLCAAPGFHATDDESEVDLLPRRSAPGHAAETAADVADPRGLARAVAAADGHWGLDEWPSSDAVARAYLFERLLPSTPADLRARVLRWRAAVAPKPAPAVKLHYGRDYRTALCGVPVHGSRCTGDPQVWHAEPPSTRCETCAAELRPRSPHRFDTPLAGIADTSGDADELLRGSR